MEAALQLKQQWFWRAHQPVPTQLPFKRGQVLQSLLLIQAKPAFEANAEAYFILWTTKGESVQYISRGRAGTAGMDVSSGLLVMFPPWGESSLVPPCAETQLSLTFLAPMLPMGSFLQQVPACPPQPQAAIRHHTFASLCCFFSCRLFCPLKFSAGLTHRHAGW